ncbi:hypothetical protein DEJ23_09010 [Curtobacterium sp. MCSS17_008]|uniref:hypothetical protein n=1 Tax=Curtobacterium sp. MCSS17_008 TaxID=2175647 RepID=UPI000DA83428|nr:hypothetical protein [Curtobacterium sp. MCSS17_008]PZF56697.1 hypothetical protein DEJ23_09010 [Curtobacterium sp. MCSS17_008]
MTDQHGITWQQDSETTWTARADDAVVATVTLGRQYELLSADDAVRGSHSSFGSAQAQFEAHRQWAESVQPD